jgi:SPP1 gp7 family putative phage head morphogenesis protein
MESAAKNILVMPRLTDSEREKIADEYTLNLTRYIQTFTEKEIVNLREKIEKNVMSGSRYESIIQSIKRSYGVSQNKAKFLARQETNLMMSSFKAARYQSAGVEEYIWTTVVGSKNHPVRPMHKALDGKIFRFDSPPITSQDGQRNNPGEDFGCRCTARPIVRF